MGSHFHINKVSKQIRCWHGETRFSTEIVYLGLDHRVHSSKKHHYLIFELDLRWYTPSFWTRWLDDGFILNPIKVGFHHYEFSLHFKIDNDLFKRERLSKNYKLKNEGPPIGNYTFVQLNSSNFLPLSMKNLYTSLSRVYSSTILQTKWN